MKMNHLMFLQRVTMLLIDGAEAGIGLQRILQ
jgi:hypothetical protein